MLRNFKNTKKQYSLGLLDIENMHPNPIEEFIIWLGVASKKNISDYNAMVLSTIGRDQSPDSRVVLLKSLVEEGLLFFTNYESNKGQQLASNPKTSIVFFWSELEQQIRIKGTVKKAHTKVSDKYFSSRQTDSQLAAIASPQSKKIASKQELLTKIEILKQSNMPIKRPENWGGYIFIPHEWEFWQGRPNRLNDRVLYTKDTLKNWTKTWLAP